MAWTISNAMMKAYANSPYSLAPEEEFSEVTYSDGELSALLNTTPMPDQFYWPDKTTEHSRLSRFGMTCVPLTESRGEELLTWFRAGFPARTSAQPEKAQGSTENEAGSGERWHGLFARYNRDSSLWKTPQCSLLGDLDEFSETWPRWGSMRNGASYLRPIPALPICVSGSGFVPDDQSFFHTPNCGGMDGGSNSRKALAGRITARVMWQTPVADDAVNRAKGKWNSRGEPKLSAQVMTWPTPRARDSQPEGLEAGRRRVERYSTCSLSTAVNADAKVSTAGLLNPNWVEWLMGWPIGWTDLKPLGTDKLAEWRQQHGGF